MLTLLIETSTERGVVCFFHYGALVFKEEFPFGLNHSKLLVLKIQEGLKFLGLTTQAIKRIGVGVGPGSYTGIRVGAMVAKTLSYSRKIPLVGISTLSCFTPSRDGVYAAVIDAKIGGIYLQSGIKEGEFVEYTSLPKGCFLSDVGEILKGPWILVTPDNRQLSAKLNAQHPGNEWTWEETAPDLFRMNRIVEEKFEKGEFSIDGCVELLYLRKTQAEIEKETRR